MPTRIDRPDALAWQVFRGSAALKEGLLSRGDLRGPGWIRLRQDVYGDSRLERTHELTCHAAAVILPPRSVIVGRSAALLHGIEHAAEFTDPVHVTVPDPSVLSPRQGLRVHATPLEDEHITSLGWCRISSPARTAWDLCAWHDAMVAVPIVDSFIGRGILLQSTMEALVAERRSERWGRRVALTIGLVDGRSQSVAESRLRVRLVANGIPVPVPQHPIVVASGRILHPDLAWPEYRVGLEYDGLWHGRAEQLHLDRQRLNQLTAAGWVILHATSARLASDFSGLLRELRTALRSRGWPG